MPGDAPTTRADGAARARPGGRRPPAVPARSGLTATVLIAVLLLCGCGPARDGEPPATDGAAASAAVEVPWADYGPGVRNRIDSWAASGDCRRLRDTRDTAVADGEAVRRRTGHGNEALVAYLDAVARSAGCPTR